MTITLNCIAHTCSTELVRDREKNWAFVASKTKLNSMINRMSPAVLRVMKPVYTNLDFSEQQKCKLISEEHLKAGCPG
jgi:hypothetical protein